MNILSRGESQMKNIRSVELKEGLEFMKEVKRVFIQENKKDKFDDFVRLMNAHKKQRIDFEDCVKRLKEIFQGHVDLQRRLNQFLPIGYKIELSSKGEQSCQKKHVIKEDAVNFLKKIKTQFQGVNDVHIYYSFLNTLIMYYKKQKSFTVVCQEVAFIFKGHPDILDEFTHFLPEATTTDFVRRAI